VARARHFALLRTLTEGECLTEGSVSVLRWPGGMCWRVDRRGTEGKGVGVLAAGRGGTPVSRLLPRLSRPSGVIDCADEVGARLKHRSRVSARNIGYGARRRGAKSHLESQGIIPKGGQRGRSKQWVVDRASGSRHGCIYTDRHVAAGCGMRRAVEHDLYGAVC
jgi:hypothetical protein